MVRFIVASILIRVVFNSLLISHITLSHWNWFLEISLVPLSETSLLGSSFSFALPVGVCVLDKAGTYVSFHELALYRRRPSSTISQDSGTSTNPFPPQGAALSCVLSAHVVLRQS